ncbi:MAG: RNA polymerase sigma factor [Candidatus Krumholzibacteriota bacterium]
MSRPTSTDLAFRGLVDRYLERVYRYLRNLTRDEDSARELAHETFLNLRRRLETGETPSEAYVFTAARNAALSAWRRRQNDNRKHELASVERPAGNPANSPTFETERKELRTALEDALGTLPEEQRSVFLLSEIEGLKYGEIAEAMGIPAGTVASRKHQAGRALREELERMGHALP